MALDGAPRRPEKPKTPVMTGVSRRRLMRGAAGRIDADVDALGTGERGPAGIRDRVRTAVVARTDAGRAGGPGERAQAVVAPIALDRAAHGRRIRPLALAVAGAARIAAGTGSG